MLLKLQTHHISYKDPEWTLELQNHMHRCISIIQHTIPTQERYAFLTNFVHALLWEFNRYRAFLDTEGADLNKLHGYMEKKKGIKRRRKNISL